MLGSYSKLPGGNVHPSRFVKLQSDNTVVEAGAGDDVYGISQPYTRNLALAGWDDGYAGISGDPAINIFGPGDDAALLELGGTVAVGDLIKPSTNGVGIKASADHDRVAARAMQAGNDGDLVRVKPMRFDVSV